MERLEISTSRKKSVLLLFGSILFVVLGIWLLMNADDIATTRNNSSLLIKFIGIAAILFFGLGIVFAVMRIIRTHIALIIDANGLYINPNNTQSGIIRWSDILEFEEISIHNTPILIVHVRDPEAWVEKEVNSMKRQLMRININQYHSPFSIASAGLNISHDELVESLNNYHKNFRLQIIK